MLFLQILLFLALAAVAGFLFARFVLVRPGGATGSVEPEWRSQLATALRERDQFRAELQDARAGSGAPRDAEERLEQRESELQAARRRIAELETELEQVRAREVPAKEDMEPSQAAPGGPADGPPGEPPEQLDAPVGAPDDLKKISGIGPGIERTLNGLGIYHYRQIAAFSPENVLWVDRRLRFRGRIDKEDWVGQAKALVEAGGTGLDRSENGSGDAARA